MPLVMYRGRATMTFEGFTAFRVILIMCRMSLGPMRGRASTRTTKVPVFGHKCVSSGENSRTLLLRLISIRVSHDPQGPNKQGVGVCVTLRKMMGNFIPIESLVCPNKLDVNPLVT